MIENIQIIEKPDRVSWDEIHEVLAKAHESNRAHGINMRKPSLPGSEIKNEVGKDGIMLVAIHEDKIIGTAALLFKSKHTWYNSGSYGYMCFAGVLPEYRGTGTYRLLSEERERIARNKNLSGLYIDTHNRNTHLIDIALKNGFRKVDVKVCKDHWNIVLFKWLNGCPYSDFKCQIEFYIRKSLMMPKRILRTIKRHIR